MEQILHFARREDQPQYLNQNPDEWILTAMREMRVAATNLMDFDKFRMALIKTAAVLVHSIRKGDEIFRGGQLTPLE